MGTTPGHHRGHTGAVRVRRRRNCLALKDVNGLRLVLAAFRGWITAWQWAGGISGPARTASNGVSGVTEWLAYRAV